MELILCKQEQEVWNKKKSHLKVVWANLFETLNQSDINYRWKKKYKAQVQLFAAKHNCLEQGYLCCSESCCVVNWLKLMQAPIYCCFVKFFVPFFRQFLVLPKMPVDGKGPHCSYDRRIFTCCAPGSCHQTALSPLFHIHSSGELHGKAGSGHVVFMISVTLAWGGPRRVSEQRRARRGMRPILQAGKRVRRPMPLRKDAIRREVLTFELSL